MVFKCKFLDCTQSNFCMQGWGLSELYVNDLVLKKITDLTCSKGILRALNSLLICKTMTTHWTCGALAVCLQEWWELCWNVLFTVQNSYFKLLEYFLLTMTHFHGIFFLLQIFRKEPFFYGHDNHDQLVKIARVIVIQYLTQFFF